jgi:hypothetical protein
MALVVYHIDSDTWGNNLAAAESRTCSGLLRHTPNELGTPSLGSCNYEIITITVMRY